MHTSQAQLDKRSVEACALHRDPHITGQCKRRARPWDDAHIAISLHSRTRGDAVQAGNEWLWQAAHLLNGKGKQLLRAHVGVVPRLMLVV